MYIHISYGLEGGFEIKTPFVGLYMRSQEAQKKWYLDTT